MFSYDHSWDHFSVQQRISLASDLGRGGKCNGRGLWKVLTLGRILSLADSKEFPLMESGLS